MSRNSNRGLQIRVFGDKELEAAFTEIGLAAQKKIFRPALRAGMKVIHQAVLARVPVDTGALKNAIKLKAAPPKRSRIGLAVFIDKAYLPSNKKSKDGKRVWFYPAHVELGYVAGGVRTEHRWLSAGVDRLGRNYARKRVTRAITGGRYVPPRSFMRAGFDAAKANALETIEATARAKMEAIWQLPPKTPSAASGGDEAVA